MVEVQANFRRMLLALIATCSILGQSLVSAADDRPLPPRRYSWNLPESGTVAEVLAAWTKVTATEVDATGLPPTRIRGQIPDNATFWESLEQIAEQSGARIEVMPTGQFRLISAKHLPATIRSLDGVFRISAKEIQARGYLARGLATYDLSLELAWEPHVLVFRIDSTPRKLRGKDDLGTNLSWNRIDSRVPVDGMTARLGLRLHGLTRKSQKIETLNGEFSVTVAEEMLRFQFKDLDVLPTRLAHKRVSLMLHKIARDGVFWILDLSLVYPPDNAEFESFETYWLSRNRLTLVSPDGSKRIPATDVEEDGLRLRYRIKDQDKQLFQEGRKGWSLEYETPSVLKEVSVTFQLRDIPLP